LRFWIGIGLLLLCCQRAPAVSRVEIPNPRSYWEREFVEMVPPIRLPTSLSGDDHITVWLRIPPGRQVSVAPDGAITYPAGTIADRVELDEPPSDGIHRWQVKDVRGTRLEKDGEWFHCLGPSGVKVSGFEWRRDDEAAERTATDGLARTVWSGRLDRLRRLNHCQECHQHDQPAIVNRSDGGPRRATDSAGWYVILSVLSDSAPLSTHRPRDLNGDDPFIAIDSGSPVARIDMARAIASGDTHALAVCRSRRYLHEHMDGRARAAFIRVFAECGL